MRVDLVLATLVFALIAFFMVDEVAGTCPTTFVHDWIGHWISSAIVSLSAGIVAWYVIEDVAIPGFKALARLANRWRAS
jgi:hypothetical protein